MARQTHYDAIIAGAGAGGATAAYFLGAAGARVLLLEREALPRYKPCGGAVPALVYDHFPFPFDGVVECETERVGYTWCAGQPVSFLLTGRRMTMVMRDRFDWHIVQHATAEVRDRTRLRAVENGPAGVTVRTDAGETIRADYLVGADGAASTVARQVGLRERRLLSPAIEAEVEPDQAAFDRYAGSALFDFGAVDHGYLWVFAKRGHLSVGIAALRSKGKALRETLAAEMARLGIDVAGARLHGHALPIYAGPERLHAGRTLLVGDAAGLVDPLSGEGIRHAVASGRMAAEAILAGDVAGYTGAVRRYAGRWLRPVQFLARVFYRYPGACYRFGVGNERASRVLTAWVNGEASYPRVINTLLLCFLSGLVRQ